MNVKFRNSASFFAEVALSHNNNEVCIYRVNGTSFELLHTLKEHSQRVTGIDWAARSNQIVTCSAVRLFPLRSQIGFSQHYVMFM